MYHTQNLVCIKSLTIKGFNFFSCFITLIETYNTMLKRNVESRHLYMFPILEKEFFSISHYI